jgi:LacI family transcriptional regulator, repressor for deo operon, udp, cdd, tsx, nupC, and nupG
VQDRGLRVPQDVAVVGWDDIDEVSYSRPSLTSISPDKAAIAQVAVSGLLAQIAGEAVPVGDQICGYRLVVRDSSAAVTGG